MISTSTTIKASCDVAYPRDRVFRHWTSQETRSRWETGPDTHLLQDNFDMRKGGREVVRMMKGNQSVGEMIQRIHAMVEGELIATTTQYIIDGETTMMMQLSLEFEDHEGGTRITALAQIVDLTGQNLTEQHKAGWAWIFARFEGDIEANGLIE